MNLDVASVCVGVMIGAVAAAILEYLFVLRPRRLRRERFEMMPMPDSVVYRNAQSVAEWHRKRLEQRINE